MKRYIQASEENVTNVLNEVDTEIRKMQYALTKLDSVIDDGSILSQSSFIYNKLTELERDLGDMEL